ncbi:10493_t:CDS:10 [Paraglomus occultum]|uniref:Fucosyltransferase n=1 Tax=Paraglomus occultum TaxID=144539 RepID=A0A9N8ZY33_9GLOM|nr:10493_t:CDS:10 [Paraglomus occultum]
MAASSEHKDAGEIAAEEAWSWTANIQICLCHVEHAVERKLREETKDESIYITGDILKMIKRHSVLHPLILINEEALFTSDDIYYNRSVREAYNYCKQKNLIYLWGTYGSIDFNKRITSRSNRQPGRYCGNRTFPSWWGAFKQDWKTVLEKKFVLTKRKAPICFGSENVPSIEPANSPWDNFVEDSSTEFENELENSDELSLRDRNELIDFRKAEVEEDKKTFEAFLEIVSDNVDNDPFYNIYKKTLTSEAAACQEALRARRQQRTWNPLCRSKLVFCYLAVPFCLTISHPVISTQGLAAIRQHFVPVSSIYGEDVNFVMEALSQHDARSDLDTNDLLSRQDGQMWVLYTAEALSPYKMARMRKSWRPCIRTLITGKKDTESCAHDVSIPSQLKFSIVYYDTKIMEQLSKPSPSFSPDIEPDEFAVVLYHFRRANHRVFVSPSFYLALENSNCDYYVTEKLQGSFAAGVVPIVMGPKNYTPFIPKPHSVIFLDDFRDPRDLAKHLRFLLEQPEEYQKYIDFRFNPQLISEEFRKDWDDLNGWNHDVELRRLCALAWMLRAGKNLTSDNPEEDWMKPRIIEADSSCDEIFDKYAYVKTDCQTNGAVERKVLFLF